MVVEKLDNGGFWVGVGKGSHLPEVGVDWGLQRAIKRPAGKVPPAHMDC